jgi:hypothetical protein
MSHWEKLAPNAENPGKNAPKIAASLAGIPVATPM